MSATGTTGAATPAMTYMGYSATTLILVFILLVVIALIGYKRYYETPAPAMEVHKLDSTPPEAEAGPAGEQLAA